jgi:AcrR family transcriptional regulator
MMGSRRSSVSRAPNRARSRPTPGPRATGRAEHLMRAALKLFALKDFGRITLRDIQRASGFDAALIYYYFRDKQDLFDAAVEFALTESLGKRHLTATERDPVTAIRKWLRHCLDMAEDNRTIFRIMFHYAGSRTGGPGFERSVQEFYRREEFDILERNIARGIADGLFRKTDAASVARFVSVHLDGITAASIVRKDFDVAAAFRDLETALWQQLDYRRGRPALEQPTKGQPAMRSTRLSIGR